MKNIYLVQRGKIVSPLATESATLSESVRLDYMGSAEFEFGALPASLKRLRDKKKCLATTLVEMYDKDGRPLRMLSYLGKEDINTYIGQLWLLRQNNLRLKERADFAENEPPPVRADFWWDIENDVMWSFHKEYMKRLESFLGNSFQKLQK